MSNMGVAYNNVLHIDIGAGAPSTLQLPCTINVRLLVLLSMIVMDNSQGCI